MEKVTNNVRLVQTFAQAAAGFEGNRIEEVKNSRRVAWWVAGAAGVVGVMGVAAALVAVLVRETPAPVVYWADKQTGAVSVMRPLSDGKDKYEETTNKFWLERFIRVCEGFDWYTISTDYSACMLMAAPNVQTIFEPRIQGPNSPLNTIKDTGRVRVSITSTSFLPDGAAQVRYMTEKTDLRGNALAGATPDKWIATMMFRFVPGRALSDREAMVNPLRFEVWGFRADPEVLK